MSGFKIGDKVRIKLSVNAPVFGWGGANPGDEGVVTDVELGSLYINLANHAGWHTIEEEIELIAPLTLENV